LPDGTRSRIQEQFKSNLFRRINSDDTLATLRKTKRGTAPGPFCDPIDALRDHATFRPQPSDSDSESESAKTNSTSSTCPCIDNFTSLVQLTLDGNILKPCQAAFSCTYFLALHKEPNNLHKVRPSGTGSALRRLCAAHATTVLGADSAKHLLKQGQFGIGIPSGLDLIIHSTMADVERHLNPTMLLLDIVNMFDAVSREACRSVLENHKKCNALIPFFDILYSTDNVCWHRTPEGTLSAFSQAEGFTQGCPLSPLFASLILHELLTDLNEVLRDRSKTRQTNHSCPGDDNLGPLSQTKSYVDNTNMLLPCRDISWFLETFTKLGEPLGIAPNCSKTQILTSTTTSESPLTNSNISEQDKQFPLAALTTPGPKSKILRGTRFLGQPAGGLEFARTCLKEKSTDCAHATTSLHVNRLTNTQTQCSRFKNCTQSTIPHLLASDVQHNLDPSNLPTLSEWTSPFTSSTTNANHHLLSKVLNTPCPLPDHSLFIASFPARDGGIGLRDPVTNATASHVIPLSRSMHCSLHSIATGKDQIIFLSAHCASSLHNWKSETLRIFKILGLCLPPITQATSMGNTPLLTSSAFIACKPTRSILRNLSSTHKKVERETLTPIFPPHMQIIVLPAQLLNKTTSFPFHSLSRRQPDHRISPATFTITPKRKLRLPITNPAHASLQCPCGKAPDVFGDHFFHCKSAPGHKTVLHDKM
jgi:hypothetical protein